MTAEDQSLETSVFFRSSTHSLYRLAQSRYANLSGAGAARYPGRWNRLGQEAIYTSIEVSVPVLELLVHTPKATIPTNLSMMHIALKGDWTFTKPDDTALMLDQATGGVIRLFSTLRVALAAFEKPTFLDAQPLAVAVPSVIVPVWNVVLYPAGKAFWKHVELRALSPFAFDPRLFREDTLAQAEHHSNAAAFNDTPLRTRDKTEQ